MMRHFAGAAAAVLALSLVPTAPAGANEGPAEPGPWKYSAIAGLNLSQSAFSDNWAGGDKGNVNWVANLDASANRQMTETLHWANKLELAYGQTSSQERDPDSPGSKVWSRPDKTTDRVFFESLARFTLGLWVDPYVSGQFESQFLDESDPIGSLMLNPIKLTETAGVAHVFEETETRELKSRLGFGFRQSLARSFTDATGDETERFSTNDGGFEFQTDAKYPLLDSAVIYTGRLKVFWPVFFSAKDDLEDFDELAIALDPSREEVADFWKDPDIDFLNTFSAEITSWLSVNLLVQWVYDKFDNATDIDLDAWDDPVTRAKLISNIDGSVRKSGQFKQTLAIGLSYRFL